jgi:hypothetical protein
VQQSHLEDAAVTDAAMMSASWFESFASFTILFILFLVTSVESSKAGKERSAPVGLQINDFGEIIG